MSKKQINKCYAIHYLDNNENKIVKTWTECSKLIKGRCNRYHGFATKQDAEDWLKSFSSSPSPANKPQSNFHKIKNNTKTYHIELDKILSDKFQNKLKLLGIKAEDCIVNLIKEYMDSKIENVIVNNSTQNKTSTVKAQSPPVSKPIRIPSKYNIDIQYEE